MAEPFVPHINPSPPAPQPRPHYSAMNNDTHDHEAALEHLVLQIGVGQLTPPPPPPPPADQIIKPATATTPDAGIFNVKVAEPINPLPQVVLNNNCKIKDGNKPQKGLSNAGNLANLLPTGTVLAFQTVTPSLSYNGRCHVFNYYLVSCVIFVCSVICFLSSFTDSLHWNGKVYYGIATSKGLRVFNDDDGEIEESMDYDLKKELKKLRFGRIDFVHAFVSVFVFLIFAFSSSEVQGCFFPHSREVEYSLVTYLPLIAGIFSSFLFTIFPTKRRGIGYT